MKTQELFYNSLFYTYLFVIIFSVSLAKLTNSVILYKLSTYINNSITQNNPIQNIENKKKNNIIDPSIIVEENGPIFLLQEDSELISEVGNTLESSTKPQEPPIPFTLMGTLEGDPSYALALIKVSGGKKDQKYIKEFKIKERIGPAKILWIAREYIIYRENGTKYTLRLGEQSIDISKKEDLSYNKKNESLQQTNTKEEIVKKVISREKVLEVIKGNQANLYKGASFGPYVHNGKIKGYKLNRVRSSHIFYTLGGRSGDIITSVNGLKLTDTRQLFDIWENIPTANNITVEILRRNKSITYNFIIQD